MSVEANKALIRRAAELFGADTLEQYLEIYHPDANLHFLPPGLPPGREGARLFYQMFLAAFPDARVTVDTLLGEGDLLAECFTVRGTHRGQFQGIPPTGRPITVTGVTIMRLEDGHIVERWSEADFLGLLRQIGAMPA